MRTRATQPRTTNAGSVLLRRKRRSERSSLSPPRVGRSTRPVPRSSAGRFRPQAGGDRRRGHADDAADADGRYRARHGYRGGGVRFGFSYRPGVGGECWRVVFVVAAATNSFACET